MAMRIRSYRSFRVDEHLPAVAAARDWTMIVTGKDQRMGESGTTQLLGSC